MNALWELSEWSCDDADDSSKVRFGERYERASLASNGRVVTEDGDAREGNGETERDTGRGICDGVCGSDAFARESAATLPFAFESGFPFTFDSGFFLGSAGDGGLDSSWTGVSTTLGKPVCGPRELRIDEKCSQSWYLRACQVTVPRIKRRRRTQRRLGRADRPPLMAGAAGVVSHTPSPHACARAPHAVCHVDYQTTRLHQPTAVVWLTSRLHCQPRRRRRRRHLRPTR